MLSMVRSNLVAFVVQLPNQFALVACMQDSVKLHVQQYSTFDILAHNRKLQREHLKSLVHCRKLKLLSFPLALSLVFLVV